MSDVQIAIGFWRETCLQASSVLAFGKVFLYNLFYKTQRFLLLYGVLVVCCHDVIFAYSFYYFSDFKLQKYKY